MGLLEAYGRYNPYGDPQALGGNPNDPNYEPPPIVTPTPTTEPHPVIDPFAPKVTTPATTGGGGGKGGGIDPGPPTGRPSFSFAPLPQYTAPVFTPPSGKDMLNDPGYQFRLNSGEDALQRSAAAKGILRTGGTLKDIIEYGQNFGSNEYNQNYGRALSTFQANAQGHHDEYAPLLAEWQTKAQAEMAAALAAYQRQFDAYTFTHQYHAPVFNIPPPPNPPEATAFSGYSFH